LGLVLLFKLESFGLFLQSDLLQSFCLLLKSLLLPFRLYLQSSICLFFHKALTLLQQVLLGLFNQSFCGVGVALASMEFVDDFFVQPWGEAGIELVLQGVSEESLRFKDLIGVGFEVL
jgi:hypothetical protein